MSDSLITLEQVSWMYFRAHERALHNISMNIGEGEWVAIMGENGAGKTTFCRLLNGLIPHSLSGKLSGAVKVDGITTSSATVAQLAERVGMVFEDPETQLFTASVADEIAFALENLLLPADVIRERVGWALNAAGLSACADYAPAMLSGGQKQRLAIAASLATMSKVLALDDPCSQLDPCGAREVLSLIRDLRAQKGLTVVMATNSSDEAAEYADTICVLKNGNLAAHDTPQRIFANKRLLDECGIPEPAQKSITLSNTKSNTNSNTICTTENAIQINNLCYRYSSGNMILRDFNLTIAEHEWIAIRGPNGCGKTTLLKNISGLLRPSGGTILLRGKDTADMDIADRAGEIGFVMQDPDRQLFCSTVYDEVAFALKRGRQWRRTLTKNELHDKVEAALSLTGMQDKRDFFPPALTRADRVKTVFAAILAMGPRIIMLDEPFAGQDMRGCLLIRDLMWNLHQQGYTLLVVTHNINIIAGYVQRVEDMSL